MLRLRDIMTTDVVTVSPEMTVREAMDVLVQHHVSGAPVVAGGVVVGVVTSSDLLAVAAAHPGAPSAREAEREYDVDDLGSAPADEEEEPSPAYFSDLWVDEGAELSLQVYASDGPEWNALEQYLVADAMTRAVYSLPPEATVVDAADGLARAKIHRVLVMAGDVLLGIVSSMDIAQAVAEHKLVTHSYVFGAESEFDDRGWEG